MPAVSFQLLAGVSTRALKRIFPANLNLIQDSPDTFFVELESHREATRLAEKLNSHPEMVEYAEVLD